MSDDKPMTETWAQEIARLGREIVEGQARLQFLLCGDPRESAAVQNRISGAQNISDQNHTIDRDAEMVELHLGPFLEHALKSSPNSATAANARNAALLMAKAIRAEERAQ
jgi:hypothetical protein